VVFAMGRDRLFWSRTETVNAGGTPGVAMLLTSAIALALIATGTFQRLVAMTSFFLVANCCLCCLALIVLRRREPHLQRLYRTVGYPWSVWIVVIGGLMFLIAMLVADSFNGLAAVGLVAVGLVARRVFR